MDIYVLRNSFSSLLFFRYPVSLFKRLCQADDLSKKDAIIWGVCNERVAIDKYRSFGDAVVEPTGKDEITNLFLLSNMAQVTIKII